MCYITLRQQRDLINCCIPNHCSDVHDFFESAYRQFRFLHDIRYTIKRNNTNKGKYLRYILNNLSNPRNT